MVCLGSAPGYRGHRHPHQAVGICGDSQPLIVKILTKTLRRHAGVGLAPGAEQTDAAPKLFGQPDRRPAAGGGDFGKPIPVGNSLLQHVHFIGAVQAVVDSTLTGEQG